MTKLTPAAARDAKPGAVIYDHEVTGLHLRVLVSKRSWYLYYSTRAKKRRRPPIGAFPDMSLSRAREVARGLKERVARGEDPSAEWDAARAAPTVEDLCERYLEEWAPRHKSARSVADDTGRINAYVMPGLGGRKVAEVTRADVDTFLEAVCERKFAAQREHPLWKGKKRSPGAANQVRRLLSKLWNLAQNDFGMDPRDKNPAGKGAMWWTLPMRQRAASQKELAAMLDAFERLEVDQPREAACLWILLLTGARVGEIASCKASELQGDRIVKVQHKTYRHTGQAKVIAVPKVALRILGRLPLSAYDGDRLFSRQTLRKTWERIRREIGCEDLQLRDFRRTFASYAASIGVTLDEIGQQLGHAAETTTRGYSWIFEDAKDQTANKVAEHMMRVGKRS